MLAAQDDMNLLTELLARGSEDELLEFKDRRSLKKDVVGKYFSALSNEARLHDMESAWLLFGVNDDGNITGSEYLPTVKNQDDLKMYIANHTLDGTSFRRIFELSIEGKRVLIMKIPATRRGHPMTFKGFAYMREGDNTLPLSDEKRFRLMADRNYDWSATVSQEATINDLDPDAITRARELFKRNKPNLSDECNGWDDITFLSKAGIVIGGGITHAAIVLLGRAESEHLLNVFTGMRWILRDNDDHVLGSKLYHIPFILAVDDICSRIRNLDYKFFSPGMLTPDRMDTYDPSLIREALHNCIAHQDYQMGEFITVVEYERDRLVFKNAGSFIPETIENVLKNDAPTGLYRNPLLTTSMERLGMVDIIGSGIRRMFNLQKNRFFPLPEYELGVDDVELTITGKVIDPDFANILMATPNMSLGDTILLDKVQKKKPLNDEEIRILRKKKMIVGRKPNFSIATELAMRTNDGEVKGRAITDRGFNDQYYTDLIIQYLMEYGFANRSDIDALLSNKLPDVLSDTQKHDKIGNLLRSLRNAKKIRNEGSRRCPKYVLIVTHED